MAGLLQDRLVHLTTGLTIHLDDLDLSSRRDESYHLQQKKDSYWSDPTVLFATFCPIRIFLIICKKKGQRQNQLCCLQNAIRRTIQMVCVV